MTNSNTITRKICNRLYILKQNGQIEYSTYEDLASKIGVSKELVSSWFSGHRNITLENLIKIAEGFNLSVGYLLEEVSPENQTMFNELGLNDESISTLKKYRDHTFRTIVNTFLSSANEDMLKVCKIWVNRGFFDIYEDMGMFYNYFSMDKKDYIETLKSDDYMFNSIAYKNYSEMLHQMTKDFLNLASVQFYFDGDERKYKEHKETWKKECVENFLKGYYDGLPSDKKAVVREKLYQIIKND